MIGDNILDKSIKLNLFHFPIHPVLASPCTASSACKHSLLILADYQDN